MKVSGVLRQDYKDAILDFSFVRMKWEQQNVKTEKSPCLDDRQGYWRQIFLRGLFQIQSAAGKDDFDILIGQVIIQLDFERCGAAGRNDRCGD